MSVLVNLHTAPGGCCWHREKRYCSPHLVHATLPLLGPVDLILIQHQTLTLTEKPTGTFVRRHNKKRKRMMPTTAWWTTTASPRKEASLESYTLTPPLTWPPGEGETIATRSGAGWPGVKGGARVWLQFKRMRWGLEPAAALLAVVVTRIYACAKTHRTGHPKIWGLRLDVNVNNK